MTIYIGDTKSCGFGMILACLSEIATALLTQIAERKLSGHLVAQTRKHYCWTPCGLGRWGLIRLVVDGLTHHITSPLETTERKSMLSTMAQRSSRLFGYENLAGVVKELLPNVAWPVAAFVGERENEKMTRKGQSQFLVVACCQTWKVGDDHPLLNWIHERSLCKCDKDLRCKKTCLAVDVPSSHIIVP